MGRRPRLAAFALILGGAAAPAPSLAQPPTPGAIALLANTMDAAAVQKVGEALTAEDPLIRTVAARIAAVTAHPSFADRIASAFERESDPSAMMEQIRALLFIRGAASTGSIEARLPTFTPLAASVYAEGLAFHQPERLSSLLPQLAARASASRAELAAAVSMALTSLTDRPEPSTALMRAWIAVAPPALWRMTLSQFADRPRPWLDAVVQELPFVERKRFEKFRAAADDSAGGALRPPMLEPEAEPMRMMPALWPGFLASLFEAAGCKPPNGPPAFGNVAVAYRPDGRVSRILPGGRRIPSNCGPPVTALARLTLQEPAFPNAPDALEYLVLPIGADHVECANRTPVESAAGNRVSRDLGIEPPQKTRDVRPQYPEEMQRRRISGIVLLEGVVGSTGCVTTLRVKRGGEVLLNYAALQAASEWRFTPTTVNGTPVPLQMTFTTTFNVR
jgi:TonB family protein